MVFNLDWKLRWGQWESFFDEGPSGRNRTHSIILFSMDLILTLNINNNMTFSCSFCRRKCGFKRWRGGDGCIWSWGNRWSIFTLWAICTNRTTQFTREQFNRKNTVWVRSRKSPCRAFLLMEFVMAVKPRKYKFDIVIWLGLIETRNCVTFINIKRNAYLTF